MTDYNPDTEGGALLTRALTALGTAKQSPVGSTARLASLEEAHALAAIASAAALMDIRSELYVFSASFASTAVVEYQPDADDTGITAEVTWVPEVGDRVKTGQGDPDIEPTAGVVQELGESDGAMFARVLFDGRDVPLKVWLDLIEPEPLSENPNPYIADGDTSGAHNDEFDERAYRAEHPLSTDDGDDDWPDGAVITPNPVFAEAVAAAKAKGKKGSKK